MKYKWERSLERTFESLEERMERGMESFERKLEAVDRRIEEKALAWERIFGEEEKPDVILEALGVKKHFYRGRKTPPLRAVDGVDFIIPRGETLGIVGESGCGKSTAARLLIGLMPATGGRILIGGEPVFQRDKGKQREVRKRTGIVFQDPYGSLDPRMTVADIVSEPLRAHGHAVSKTDMLLKSLVMLESCGMRADDMFRYPHQFSGGQRQRICIARALVSEPDLVICDEAVSSLDVSVQAQIINLLLDFRDRRTLTYLFISHDLEVVRFIADRVAVMYLGTIVEMAKKEDLFLNPVHPYTKILLESAPVFGRKRVFNQQAPDWDDNGEDVRQGCRFLPRCPNARHDCGVATPKLRTLTAGHSVACHRI